MPRRATPICVNCHIHPTSHVRHKLCDVCWEEILRAREWRQHPETHYPTPPEYDTERERRLAMARHQGGIRRPWYASSRGA